MQARKGELVCVVGRVGSGKSSLVQALLGEMERQSGSVAVGGRLAYAAQQAWIINASGGCEWVCSRLAGWRGMLCEGCWSRQGGGCGCRPVGSWELSHILSPVAPSACLHVWSVED